ncbi:MAG: hypothetical protein K2J70_08305 [Muribaculaceae bacterium]|nr:hypothetical protein [Muribaculaceae bacterium]
MRRTITAVLVSLVAVSAAPEASAQEKHRSFDEFRKEVLSGYQNFRKTILDNYADFLNGEWHEYQSLNAERRDKTPKPTSVPSVGHPSRPGRLPSGSEAPATPPKPLPVEKGEAKGKRPESETAPSGPSRPTKSRGEQTFGFYGLPVTVPEIEFNIAARLSTPSDYAAQWKALDREEVRSEVLPALQKKIREMGLNDYLAYMLMEAYIGDKFPQADSSSKISAIHYLLTHAGYDARVAMTGRGAPLLLLPFKQTIYARNYIMMPEGKYYVFAPDGFDYGRLATEGIKTCTLPKDADKGSKLDLVIGKLNIPVKAKSFELEYGPIHLKGEVNENLMPILYRYPQMPIGDYAVSSPDPALRHELARQIREQLQGMEGDKAVEALLGFTQSVFDYATDEENHGFEKPYFIEETLYYPKNDCEDRAIFYTTFLWNALGREAQLISFPGHEAATVRLDSDVEGTSYTYGGDRYYISDPTFIGSHTGMVMPIYRNEKPKVDYTFSNSGN